MEVLILNCLIFLAEKDATRKIGHVHATVAKKAVTRAKGSDVFLYVKMCYSLVKILLICSSENIEEQRSDSTKTLLFNFY